MAAGLLAGGHRRGVVAVAVAVRVGVPARSPRDGVVGVVDQPVTVVVQGVADFLGVGVDARVGVVAVGVVGDVADHGLTAVQGAVGIAEAVTVRVGVPGGLELLVHRAVAVVVDAVARLDGCGVDGGVAVVTVGGQGRLDPTLPGVAAVDAGARITEAITVAVQVPALGQVLVHGAVAVVVQPVAALRRAGVGLGVSVVAVLQPGSGIRDEAAGRLAGGLGHVGIAVAVTVRVGVPGLTHSVIDEPVAVVVQPVADLLGARVDGRVAVVAVLVGGVAVPVQVHDVRPGVDRGVAAVDLVRLGATGDGQKEGKGQQGAH